MSSSEDINETIESLSACIKNNSQGLQRALNDLQSLSEKCRDSNIEGGISQRNVKTITTQKAAEISDSANKILFQFENFSEYSHAEVNKISKELQTRETICK